MKTIALFTVILATCLLPSKASARLGETKAQCIARYGEPVEKDKLHWVFIKNSYKIECDFREEDGCWRIAYNAKNGTGLMKDEIDAILRLMAPKWEEKDISGTTHFNFEKGVDAFEVHGVLVFCYTVDCEREIAKRDAARLDEARKKLKGL